jgi:hypothetical protein
MQVTTFEAIWTMREDETERIALTFIKQGSGNLKSDILL